jgi:hypothetical protein
LWRATGIVPGILPLGNDALEPELACVLEHNRAVLFDVLVQANTGIGTQYEGKYGLANSSRPRRARVRYLRRVQMRRESCQAGQEDYQGSPGEGCQRRSRIAKGVALWLNVARGPSLPDDQFLRKIELILIRDHEKIRRQRRARSGLLKRG